MKKTLMQEFVDPGSEYRGAPFWAWNGKLEPEELRRQIRLMHSMGLGGFFMHSRVGLDTKYLSDDWFKCVDACIDEAEKLDMQAWLYDEDRWPSGAAGGLVTKDHRYRVRRLVMTETGKLSEFKWKAETLAAFAVRIEDACIVDYRRIAKGKRPSKLARGESILAFDVVVAKDSDWYNGQAYLDCLSHEAVKKFIEVTHDAYRKRVGKHFGKRVPGIFTDEPNFPGAVSGNSTVWTGSLPAAFRKRYGYDLVARLPEVFFGRAGELVSRVKYNYIDCITFLFTDAFARQIGEWCEKNNLPHTGHVLSEETQTSQTRVVGSAMRFYQHMQIPGMDLLTEHNREYDTPKQVTSVARQFGRRWRLDEIYGCTGWDFPFLGHKALGDWQAALGINIRCQHLSWYTMEGQAKRDYPAGIFYQNTWYQSYAKVEDYFARVNLVLSTGVDVRDALVIHPVESTWTICGKDWARSDEARERNRLIVQVRDSLLVENIDFDYGDESIMAEHGRTGTKNGAPYLRINKAEYKAVVVPPMRTMRRSTLELLRKFSKAGGRVVFAGAPAEYVDALPSRDVAEFAGTCVRTPDRGPAIASAIADVARRVSIADSKGSEIASALYQLREDKDALYLFVCNTGHKRSELKAEIWDETMARDRRESFKDVRVTVSAPGHKGLPLELDTEIGAVYSASAKRNGEKWIVSTDLPALGSRIFMFPKSAGRKPAARQKHKAVSTKTMPAKNWSYALSEDNALVLDRPKVKIGTGKWFQSDDAVNADLLIRDALGIKRRGGEMVQPWARVYPEKLRMIDVGLEYTFDVAQVPSGSLFLAIERPETFEIEVNGCRLDPDSDTGWWCDRSLRKLPVDPGILRKGRNTITMSCDYDEKHPGLETVYLLGAFGAAVKGTDVSITALPKALRVGDWVRQGLPFYSGSVSYRQTIKPKLSKSQRLVVEVPEYRGAAVRVLVNGKEAGIIGWEPNEVDITECLTGGTDELSIEVLGHRRNSHGPLHNSEKWPRWTGPGEFLKGDGKRWVDGYQLVPCGLMKAPRLVIKKIAG